jgi:hypothetical protein
MINGLMPVADFSHSYQSAVDALLKGSDEIARQQLGTVLNWSLPGEPSRSNRSISERTQIQIFRRDKFTCRYCNRRTVIVPLLRLLSIAFTDIFPYHPNWRMDKCHLGYWRDVASCDHVIPIARMGTSQPENLITACYMCNSIKQNWLVEELRWEIQPVADNSDWDGLSSYYCDVMRLYEGRYPVASGMYFRKWRDAVLQECQS